MEKAVAARGKGKPTGTIKPTPVTTASTNIATATTTANNNNPTIDSNMSIHPTSSTNTLVGTLPGLPVSGTKAGAVDILDTNTATTTSVEDCTTKMSSVEFGIGGGVSSGDSNHVFTTAGRPQRRYATFRALGWFRHYLHVEI